MMGQEGWNPEDYEEELGETGGIRDKINQMRMQAAERSGGVRRQSTGLGPRGERAPGELAPTRWPEDLHESDFPPFYAHQQGTVPRDDSNLDEIERGFGLGRRAGG